MRNYQETLDWYKQHQSTETIGFNPDRMCLKVCRTARDIPAKYQTAKQAQEATPKEHRVYKIRDLRRGMVLYFDDPRDANRAGHIVTMVGRVRDGNPDSLNDVLVITNSVFSGQLVVVRASYFLKHWGDPFQFGATWLNGVELDIPKPESRVTRFHKSAPRYDINLLDAAIADGRTGLKDERDRIVQLVNMLPRETQTRVATVSREFKAHRVLRLDLLNEAVEISHRVGPVKTIRDGIREAIGYLPKA